MRSPLPGKARPWGQPSGQPFTYDSRGIPGVKGQTRLRKRTWIWITNLVRWTDPFDAHYLFLNFLQMSPASAKCKCVVKPSHRGGGDSIFRGPRSIGASKIPASWLKGLSHATQDSRARQRPEKIWMVSRPAKRFASRV